MKYMLLIHHDEAAMAKLTPAEWQEAAAAYAAFNDALAKAGAGFSPGERLQPSSVATSVRVRDGRMSVLDGPYAETRERFAGYFFVDVPDLDQAIAWAVRCPSVAHGVIEIRPFWVATANQWQETAKA